MSVDDDSSSIRSCFGKELYDKSPKCTVVYSQGSFGTRQRRNFLVNGLWFGRQYLRFIG